MVSFNQCAYRFKSGNFGLIDKRRPGGRRKYDDDDLKQTARRKVGANTKITRGTVENNWTNVTVQPTSVNPLESRIGKKTPVYSGNEVKLSRDNLLLSIQKTR